LQLIERISRLCAHPAGLAPSSVRHAATLCAPGNCSPRSGSAWPAPRAAGMPFTSREGWNYRATRPWIRAPH